MMACTHEWVAPTLRSRSQRHLGHIEPPPTDSVRRPKTDDKKALLTVDSDEQELAEARSVPRNDQTSGAGAERGWDVGVLVVSAVSDGSFIASAPRGRGTRQRPTGLLRPELRV